MKPRFRLSELLEEIAQDEMMDAPAKSLRVSQEEINELMKQRRKKPRGALHDSEP